MPHTDEAEALKFAERIRKNIKIQLAEQDNLLKEVTVSLGVASYFPNDGNAGISMQQVIAQADQALYLAKNRGRDQVQTLNNLKSCPAV